jgi:serine/threonine protein kinase
MLPQPGQPLVDTRTGEARFRLDRYFRQGRNYDLLLGTDLHEPGGRVVLKAIRYEAGADADRIRERRALVEVESAALSSVHPALPFPEAVITLDNPALADVDAALAQGEPVLVYRWIDAEPLPAWLAKHHPKGAPLEIALDLMRQLAGVLDALHEHSFVHRCASPEHLLIDASGTLHLVGMGNVVRKAEKVSTTREFFDPHYCAPEIEREISGRFAVPRADIFTMGAVLGYLVSAESPTGFPESPWTRSAHERITALPAGMGLLIAHCMQPMAKKRFAHAARLQPWLTPDSLPTRETKEFAELTLTVPWLGNQPDAARIGRLSAGPLVSRSAGAITQAMQRIDISDPHRLPPAQLADDVTPSDSEAVPESQVLPGDQPAPPAASPPSPRVDTPPVLLADEEETARPPLGLLIAGVLLIVVVAIALLRQLPLA